MPSRSQERSPRLPLATQYSAMSQEREFLETLIAARVNYFLVFYSLIVIAGVTTRQSTNLSAVLGMGTVVCFLLAISICRADIRLAVAVRTIHDDSTTPAAAIEFELLRRWGPGLWRILTVRWIIGWFIPFVCTLSLLLGFILACLGRLQPG